MDDNQDKRLRLFIKQLKDWAVYDPPSEKDFTAMKKEFRLTRDEQEKLDTLAQNHIQRGMQAREAGAFEQAIAEMSRAAQLQPHNPSTKMELTNTYIQRMQEIGSNKKDRIRIFQLLQKILDLQPKHQDALRLFKKYRLHDANIPQKGLRYLVFLVFLLFLSTLGVLWWQREWFFSFLQIEGVATTLPGELQGSRIPQNLPSRSIPVETPNIEQRPFTIQIVSAELGHRNDTSFLHLKGKVKSTERNMEKLRILILGRNKENETKVSIPWDVLDKEDPLLLEGDTQPFSAFHWLAESEESLDYLELHILDATYASNPEQITLSNTQLLWETPRPEGATLKTQVRERYTIEAYDRQVLFMHLVLENTGVTPLDKVMLNVSLKPEWPNQSYQYVSPQQSPLEKGERRVMPLTLSLPLDAQIEKLPIIIRIEEARRAEDSY